MAIKTLGAALRQINRLFADGTLTGLSDAQLLERFVSHRDATSFEALVARHGPMVLSVCRGILRDPNDADDAFQATFLILVKKAGSIRGHVVLGGWLYRVAHRVAIQANAAAARRRAREREAGRMTTASISVGPGPGASDDLLPALHEEITRLPEKYRLPILLCDLEGLPQAQAAGQLRWSERTLRRRLSEGRSRLKARLARRGLMPDSTMLGFMCLREARASLPAALNQKTVRAALDLISHTVTAGALSTAAQSFTQEVLRIMLVQKLKLSAATLLGAGIMAWGASAAWISLGDEPKRHAAAAGARAAALPATARQDSEPDPLDAVGTFPVHGRVIDPDGKPIAGAEIYVHHLANDVMASATSYTIPSYKSGRVTTSDADGRFRFELDKAASDFPFRDDPVWHSAQIAAVAPGFGPAWFMAGSLLKDDEAKLRLVRDDVPIRGRVLDFEGRPVAGVMVYAREIREADMTADKDALLASGTLDFARTTRQFAGPTWLGRNGTWTTDGDGRFEVKGLGRDRIVALELRGPAQEKVYVYAMARFSASLPQPSPSPRPTRPAGTTTIGRSPLQPLVGASFEQIVGPAKPIIGVVRLKGSGKPVAGVHVLGVEPATRTEVSALTDAQGRFRLMGLPKAGSYRVRAAPRPGIDPFLGAQIDVTDTAGLTPIETALELPKGVIVTGRLVDRTTGRPVRAKHVHYAKLPANPNQGQAALGTSGLVDPVFRLTVSPGPGMIYANVRGTDLPYTRAQLRPADKGKGIGGIGDGETFTILLAAYHAYKIVDVPADAELLTVDLKLTRGLSRKGRVVDPDGRPVAGAQCYGLVATWGLVRTLADDAFEVTGLEPDHPRLLIFAHQGRRLVGSVIIRAEDAKSDAPMVVRLEPPGSIKGRLVDEDGLPVASATLRTQSFGLDGSNLPPGPGRNAMWPDGETFTTDAEGRFQIDGLKPGIKTNGSARFKDRPSLRLDTGRVLRDIVIQRPGGVRDLGDVKVKVVPK